MIKKAFYYGTNYPGLYLSFALNRLIAHESFPKLEELAKAIGAEPVKAKAETHLVGLISRGNSRGLITTELLPVEVEGATMLKTKFTAIGNLMIANDKGALIGPDLEPFKQEIEKALGVKAEVGTIAGLSTIGFLAVCNNNGCLVAPEASEDEIKKLEKALKVDVERGTLNEGSSYVGLACIASDHGALVSYLSSGFELSLLSEVLEV